MTDNDVIIPAQPGTKVLVLTAFDDEREIESRIVPVVAWRIEQPHNHDLLVPISTISFSGDNVIWMLVMDDGKFITGHWGSDIVYTEKTAMKLAQQEMGKRIRAER